MDEKVTEQVQKLTELVERMLAGMREEAVKWPATYAEKYLEYYETFARIKAALNREA